MTRELEQVREERDRQRTAVQQANSRHAELDELQVSRMCQHTSVSICAESRAYYTCQQLGVNSSAAGEQQACGDAC